MNTSGESPQPPLAAAREPHPPRLANRLDERVAVGDGAIGRVQHRQIGGARRLEQPEPRPVLVVCLTAARRRNDDDRHVGAAGLLEKTFDDAGAHPSATADDERPVGRPNVLAGHVSRHAEHDDRQAACQHDPSCHRHLPRADDDACATEPCIRGR